MADLFFPQLMSGALAQYPLRKTRVERTIRNVLPDGDLILFPDVGASRTIWQLAYTALSPNDLGALVSFFEKCQGRLRKFTLIDPTENMLVNSTNFNALPWRSSSLINFASGVSDPSGSSVAFTLTNNGQADAEINQSLTVPASYQYCFSVYASSAVASTLTLIRRSATAQQTIAFPIGPHWQRLVSQGRLSDAGLSLTIAMSLAPGQQVSLFAPQLEPQLAPSRYRPTGISGGVHANAHWAVDELPVSADAPDLFSTAFTVETSI